MASRREWGAETQEEALTGVPKTVFDVRENIRRRPGRPITSDKASDALPAVERTPCFRCGARADIGCKCKSDAIVWLASLPGPNAVKGQP